MKTQPAKKYSPIHYIILFIVLFTAQSYVYQIARSTWVEHLLIDVITVKPSALLLDTILPQENVHADGAQLISQTTRVTVLNGCEGTESMFVLIAAILAFNAAWRYRLMGVLSGILFIYMLNQIRIASLFIVLKYNREWFHWLHAYIGPTLIIILSCIFFLGWLHAVRSHNASL